MGQWQALITRYFYDCSDEMLSGLGGMYVADERFTRQTDRYAEGGGRLPAGCDSGFLRQGGGLTGASHRKAINFIFWNYLNCVIW